MQYQADFESRIAGIPCLIAVTDYEPYVPAYISGPPEYCYPSEGGYGEYVVLDRRGRRAEWLERKITDRINSQIQQEIFEYMEG